MNYEQNNDNDNGHEFHHTYAPNKRKKSRMTKLMFSPAFGRLHLMILSLNCDCLEYYVEMYSTPYHAFIHRYILSYLCLDSY